MAELTPEMPARLFYAEPGQLGFRFRADGSLHDMLRRAVADVGGPARYAITTQAAPLISGGAIYDQAVRFGIIQP